MLYFRDINESDSKRRSTKFERFNEQNSDSTLESYDDTDGILPLRDLPDRYAIINKKRIAKFTPICVIYANIFFCNATF